MARLRWIDDVRAEVGDVEFVCTFPSNVVSKPTRFGVLKGKDEIEEYQLLVDRIAPRTILELGAWSGGSAALMWLMAEPDRMAVLDREPDPAPALDLFARMRGIDADLRRYWSTDQADIAALDALMADTFGDRPIDLAIDDASHIIGPTRVSFDRVFPKLRPGGVFVLEDWAHEHRLEAQIMRAIEEDPAYRATLGAPAANAPPDRSPLSIMVFELVVVAACRPDVIASVVIDDEWVCVTRGDADLRVGGFSLASSLGGRGQRMVDSLEAIWPE